MMRRWLAALVGVLVIGLPARMEAAAPKRPNILFVFTDDQRWDTIHALGNKEISTPRMDRLVENGFRFNNAYCMGAMVGAVCLPSRTMLITGQSLWHCPQAMRAKTAPPGTPVLPTLLADARYETFHCGKSGNACTFGNAAFQTNITIDYRTPATSVDHANRTITFLKNRPKEKPFFIYLAPPVPHDPRVAPEPIHAMYDPTKLTLSPNFMPKHPFDNGELKVRDETLAAIPRQPDEMRQHLADYYAAITHFDQQMGRILDTVKELGLEQETIVLFSSDQGLAVGGRHGLMGKQNLYEHVKPPLIISGPGIPHGQSDALVYLYDLFPTICDLAGVSVPSAVEGKSLMPVMTGKTPRVRDTLFGAYRDVQRMIRDERWKLMKYHVRGKTTRQLFDLKNDPHELTNLAGDPAHAETLARLEKSLQESRRKFDDPVAFPD